MAIINHVPKLLKGLSGLEEFKRVWKSDADIIEALKSRKITAIGDAVGWALEEELLISLFDENPKLAELLEKTFDRAYRIKEHEEDTDLSEYSIL